MTIAKYDVFIGLYFENVYLAGEGGIDLWLGRNKNLVGGSLLGVFFQVGRKGGIDLWLGGNKNLVGGVYWEYFFRWGGMSKFLAGERGGDSNPNINQYY